MWHGSLISIMFLGCFFQMNITRFLKGYFYKQVGLGAICSHIDKWLRYTWQWQEYTIIKPNYKHRIIMKKNYIKIKWNKRWVENQSLSYTLVE